MRSVSNTNVGDVLTEAFVQDVRAHMANSAMHSGIGGGGVSTDVATHNSSTTSHTDIRNAIAALQAGGAGGTDVTTHNNDAAAHSALLLPDSALPEIVTAYSGSTVPTTLATATNNTKRITALQIAKLIKGLPTSSASATNFDSAIINVPYSAYNGARVDVILPYTKFNSKAFIKTKIFGWDGNTNYLASSYNTLVTIMFVGPHDDLNGTQTYMYDWDGQPVEYNGIKVNKPIDFSAVVNGVSDNTKNLKVTIVSRMCNSSNAFLTRLVRLYNHLTNTSATNKTYANIVGDTNSDLNAVSMNGIPGFMTDGLSSENMINDYQVKVECISVNK